MLKIAILIPAFNEEETIEEMIKGFHKDYPNASIWVINNASTDHTEDISRRIFKLFNISGGVINEPQKGKGNAVRCAFTKIDSDIYAIADADCTYSTLDLNNLIKAMLVNGADMVIGDRLLEGAYHKENKRPFHSFGNKLLRTLINYLFNSELKDTQSGYRVFSNRFVKTYPALAEGFNIETDMTLHALDKRLKIIEVPIKYVDRPRGSISKLNTISDGFLVLKTLINIFRHYRPLVFFSFLSFIFFIVGIVLGFPVIQQHFETGAITRIPLAILSSGIEIIAVLLASIGLILDSISYHDKQNFERNLRSFKVLPIDTQNKDSIFKDE